MPRVKTIRIILAGRAFFAVGMVAFGVLFFLFAGSVAHLAPAWPGWLPGMPWAYVAGATLAAGGAAILLGMRARVAALLLGSVILLWEVARDVDANEWTSVFQALAMSGTAFILAATPLARKPASA
jgi:uncharacterized membrane protein YphA (DoxX/SURF4 family)